MSKVYIPWYFVKSLCSLGQSQNSPQLNTASCREIDINHKEHPGPYDTSQNSYRYIYIHNPVINVLEIQTRVAYKSFVDMYIFFPFWLPKAEL